MRQRETLCSRRCTGAFRVAPEPVLPCAAMEAHQILRTEEEDCEAGNTRVEIDGLVKLDPAGSAAQHDPPHSSLRLSTSKPSFS